MNLHALAALLAAAALAGCTTQPEAKPAAPSGPVASSSPAVAAPGAGCPADAGQGTPVRFDATGGRSIGGVLLGDGPNAVVLAHQSTRDLCVWLNYGLSLAKLGYRVLAFDFPGHGSSPGIAGQVDGNDAVVASAVTFMRGRGVSKVVLIGATMGATAVVVAAADIAPPVNGVVSLSGSRRIGPLDAELAARRLLVTTMFMAAEHDSTHLDDAYAMFEAMPSLGVEHSFTSVDGSAQGVAMLDVAIPNGYSRGDTVHAQIETFLREAFAANG